MSENKYIFEKLKMSEVLAQLAEECSELGKAALKLRRVIDGRNPTPVTIIEASENMAEEIADVLLCLEVIGFELDELDGFKGIMDAKRKRWVTRLQEREGAGDRAE